MKKTIKEILKIDTLTDFGFSVSYTDGEGDVHNYTVFNNENFRQLVRQRFGQRVYNDYEDDSTEEDFLDDFADTFATWKATRSDTYARRMYALSLHYDPLENYHSNEIREGSFTHGKQTELSFDGRKDIQKDDSFVEKSYTGYKETTKDDSFVDHTFTNYKETTTDDTYTEHSFTNYKETTTDDTYTEHSYTNYQETNNIGQRQQTHNISADDASTFVASDQTTDAAAIDTKGIAGSYKDQRGGTNGIEKTTTGSYKDQRGGTNGIEKSTSGSYKDQNGFTQIGNERSIVGTIKDQKGFTNGLVGEKVGKEISKDTGTDLDGYSLERWGNIGVTTSQQMLASDLDFLKFDIVMDAIREFLGGYTYISAEVD